MSLVENMSPHGRAWAQFLVGVAFLILNHLSAIYEHRIQSLLVMGGTALFVLGVGGLISPKLTNPKLLDPPGWVPVGQVLMLLGGLAIAGYLWFIAYR